MFCFRVDNKINHRIKERMKTIINHCVSHCMRYLFKLHLPFTQMFASHLNSIGARSGKGEGFTDKASVEFIFRESEEWMNETYGESRAAKNIWKENNYIVRFLQKEI